MDFFTHIVISFAVANQLHQDEDSFRAFIIGGLAPDVDVLVSWLPALIPQLFILQHRGLFHTVFAAPFIVILLILSINYSKEFIFIKRLQKPFQELNIRLNSNTVIWGVIGFFLHLCMDIITQGGLILFYPLINQRITISIISVFDPLITLLSSVLVFRFVYSKLTGSNTHSLLQFKKAATSVTILFVILLGIYGFFQVTTIVNHSPSSTSPDIIPLFRWTVMERNKTISIHIINQLTQNIISTYNYSSLTYNQTYWDILSIESVVEQAKATIKYKRFEFQLGSDTRLAINVTFNEMENRWEISFLDTLHDAQNRFYGISNWSLMETEVVIYLNQS